MASGKATLSVQGEAAEIALPSSGFKSGASLDVVGFPPEALLLLREGQAARGYFAGSLQSVSLGEVFGQIVSGIRTGKLWVVRGAARRVVSFRDGQVTFASSTEPHERLGRALVRHRKITKEQLEAALQKVKAPLKLGQVLNQEGLLTGAALYSAMTLLVREIVLDLFELTEGHFLFAEGPLPAGEDTVKLPERTKDLVLEGIKHGDEVSRLQRRYPATLRLQAGEGADREDPLLTLAAAGASVGDLRAAFEGGTYAFLQWLDDGVRRGDLVEEQPAAPSAPAKVDEPRSAVELYAALVRSLCQALRAAGKDLTELRSFFSDPLPGMEETFQGVQLSDDGELDVDRVLANAQATGGAMGRAKAYEALESFVSYALFAARNVVPAETAESLTREFRRIQEGGGT